MIYWVLKFLTSPKNPKTSKICQTNQLGYGLNLRSLINSAVEGGNR